MTDRCWADGYEVGSAYCRDFHNGGPVVGDVIAAGGAYTDPDEGTVILVKVDGIDRVFLRVYAQGGYDGWVDQTGEKYVCDTVIRLPGKLLVRARHAVIYEVVAGE